MRATGGSVCPRSLVIPLLGGKYRQQNGQAFNGNHLGLLISTMLLYLCVGVPLANRDEAALLPGIMPPKSSCMVDQMIIVSRSCSSTSIFIALLHYWSKKMVSGSIINYLCSRTCMRWRTRLMRLGNRNTIFLERDNVHPALRFGPPRETSTA